MNGSGVDVEVDELREVGEVNLFGNLEMIKRFRRILGKNQGRILNLRIGLNRNRFLDGLSYIGSKCGLNWMIKLLGRDFKKNKIPVEIFGVMGGGIRTD
uniref:SDR family NAD(P)-dependent oxidoreductase n=1 Tax=Staphylococcus warneri TaxID=1292 RepID=UPI0021B3501A